MSAPVYSSVVPFGGAAGDLTTPAVPGDGNVYWLEGPTGGNLLLYGAEGGGGGGTATYPASWATYGIYAENLLVIAGVIWAGLNGGGGGAPMIFAYWDPVTNANGQYGVSSFVDASYQLCVGPASTIWGATLQNFVAKYVPHAGAQTIYHLGGSVTVCVCSDGAQVYVLDNAGADSVIWAVTSLGVGTQYSPGIVGLAASMIIGPNGNLWTSVVSGATMTVYEISTAGVLLNTYVVALPGGVSQGGNIINGPDGTMWITADSILVNITTTGAAQVWSLEAAGAATANANGTVSVDPGAAAGPQNIYITGVVPPTTVGHLITAALPSGENPMRLLA